MSTAGMKLSCSLCGREHASVPTLRTCGRCGETGILSVDFDYERVCRELTRESLAGNPEESMWRYLPLLPCDPGSPRPRLRAGWTPLYRADLYGRAVGLTHVYIKDDGLNPTASLKDRASAMAVVKALEAGADTVACSSTGNAGSSLAGMAASAGLRSVIFVPQRAPKGKLAQLLLFGAKVIVVQGDYEDAFRLSQKAISRWGWFDRNAGLNPYLVEGKKTVSLEIAEQMQWKVPDWVAVSVGDGCTVTGAVKGFLDLYNCGLVDRVPRFLGVQAEGVAPIYQAFRDGTEILVPSAGDTLADSIAVAVPRNPVRALRAIRQSGGEMLAVSDEEIVEAMRVLGSTSGVLSEPAAAAAFAGLASARRQGIISPGEIVVGVVTGNGLKDVDSCLKAAPEPVRIPPDLDQLEMALIRERILPDVGCRDEEAE